MAKEKKRIRKAFEAFKLVDELAPEDWLSAGDELRRVARRLGLPYLMLLVEYYRHVTPRMVTLADVTEWNDTPAAREVLVEMWAREATPAKAVA
jgi:hypothetical protein